MRTTLLDGPVAAIVPVLTAEFPEGRKAYGALKSKIAIALDLQRGTWHTSTAMSCCESPTLVSPVVHADIRPCVPVAGPALEDESKSDNGAVRRGFSWLALGNIVNAACAWGRVALLARLGSAEMIGQLTLALAVCNPITTLADLGLSGSLISDFKRQYRLGDYLGLRLLTCGLAILAIIFVSLAGGYDPATARLIILAGFVVVIESVCDLFQAVLQRREQMRWVAISLMLRGMLGLALFALGTWFSGELAWGVCGFSLAALTTLLAIDVPRAVACERLHDRNLGIGCVSILRGPAGGLAGFRRKASVLVGLALLSLPLGLATASLSLMTSIPRYWISSRLGNEALGGFAVAGSLMVAISLVVGAMSQAASPRLAQYHAAGNTDAIIRLLRSLGLWLAAAMFISLIVIGVAGQWVIGLLFGPAYVAIADVALCLTLAAGLRNFGIFLGRAITSMRRFRTSLVLRVVGIVALVLMLPGWIDWLGLLGAAWALTLSWLITGLLSLAAVVREVRRCDPHAQIQPSKEGQAARNAA
jgi:O-antigen/teichoic acid export membrane protein